MESLINSNITNLKPSATLVINERSNALVAAGKKVYKLGFGQSPFPVIEKWALKQQKPIDFHQSAFVLAR